MANYLVTGRAGSGKSSIVAELRARGFDAFDTDEIEGLSSWVERTTGAKVQLTDNTNVDLTQYDWLWDEDILRHFISDKDRVFVCGSAENDFSFESYFAKHFALDVPAQLQIERLLHRTTNDYGKDPAMHEAITRKQAEHIAQARRYNTVILDASMPIKSVVNQLLEKLQ